MSAIFDRRKRKTRSALCAALFLCAHLLLLSGCSSLRRYSVTYADVFDTVTTFTAYCRSRGEFDALAEKLHAQLLEDHRRFDIYREYPGLVNLCTLNRLAGEETVTVDRELMDLLQLAQAMYAQSGGKLNIALGPVLRLWEQARAAAEDPAAARLPEEAELREAAEHCHMEDLMLDAGSCAVRFLDPMLQLDVGAVGKGCAQARAMALLEALNCGSCLLNMGGSVCCRGCKPDGDPWLIGLEDPLDKSRPMRTFPLADSSAVTSGVDQRYFMLDGVRYHHLIDPDTCAPGRAYTQVTVIMPDPSIADALSTALFLLEPEAGKALAESWGAEALWMLPDGSELRTDGFPALK